MSTPSTRRSPAFLATAIALPVAVVAGLIVAAVLAGRTPHPSSGPVALAPQPAPAASGPDCRSLVAALPTSLGNDYAAADIAAPAPTATRAWRTRGGDTVVVRCGLPRPMGFTVTSQLQVVDGVQWFQTTTADGNVPAGTWYAVDRPVYIALGTPAQAGPTPIQEVSDTIARTLPARPLDPTPLPR